VLPLLRIYMAWLCSHRSELVEFRPHLEPQFGTMCTTLGNTLTLLFKMMGGDQQLGNPVSWCFPEDEMTLGITCLNGPDLPAGCQLSHDAFTLKPKPRREEVSGANGTDDDVSFTRALDVLLCALDLSAPESKFPLTTSSTKEGAGELTTFVYLEGGKPEPAPRQQEPQQPAPTAAPPVVQPAFQTPVVAPSPCESNELSEDQEFYGPELRNATHHGARNGRAPAAVGRPQVAPVSEFPIDKQIFNILNDFINPPESAPAPKPETPSRPSARVSPYGMDSAAVAGAFGAGPSGSPAPGSAGAKAFPTLPWEYFYTPAPVDSTLRNSGVAATGAGWGANGSGFGRPASLGNTAQLGIGASIGNPLARQTHQRYDSLGHSRLVDNQADALGSLDLGSDPDQYLQGYGARGVWSNAAAESSTSARGAASNAAPQSPWAPSANPWQSAYGQNTAASGHPPNSPFSTLNFSGNTSSLPQVNSPWGLPTNAQRFSATQSPSSPTHLGAYPGGSIPSPSYAGDYAAAMADAQASQAFLGGGGWPDARQPRNGLGQQSQPQPHGLDVWGNLNKQPAAAAGQKADGKSVMQGMPKR